MKYAKKNVTEEELRKKVNEGLEQEKARTKLPRNYIYDIPSIDEDLFGEGKQVQFDCENITDPDNEESWFCWPEMRTVGYATLENGLEVCWYSAGGDWEAPIAFIVYLGEDDQLHAYVPERGNCYNKKFKSAYGNNDDYEEADDDGFDQYEMEKDIIENIVFRGA